MIKKICDRCGEEFETSNNKFTTCKSCYWGRVSAFRRNRRVEAIEYLGGKCAVCGYVGDPTSMQFHHIDASTKDKDYDNMLQTWTWDEILEELDKCMILCANCHSSYHQGGIRINWKWATLVTLILIGVIYAFQVF